MIRVPSECCLCLKREAATAHTTAFRVSVSWFCWYRFLMFTWSRWGSVRLSSTECWQTEEPTEGRSYREVSPFVPTAFPAKTNPIARYWTWEKQKDDDSGCFYFIYSFTHLIWIIEETGTLMFVHLFRSFYWRTDGSSLPRDRTVSGQRGRSQLRRSLYKTNTAPSSTMSRQRIMRKDMLSSQGQRVLTQLLTSSTMTD